MRILVGLVFGLLMTNYASAQKPQAAEQIFVNGDIYPGLPMGLVWSGFERPPKFGNHVQAIAISSGKIIAVGSNAEIEKLKGPHTQVIDLDGHFAMPGFNDAHTH